MPAINSAGTGREGRQIIALGKDADTGAIAATRSAMLLCMKFYVDRMFNQLMKRQSTIIDASQTITVEERVTKDDVIDAIGPREGEHREKPPQ